jgi:hypothetical protein
MATLSTRAEVDYDDEDSASAAAAIPKDLTWSWRTWPSNLRRAAAVSAGLVMAMIALVFFLQEQDKEFTQKLDTNTGSRAQAQTKLRESGQEQGTIVKHLPVLKELEEKSIFGEEKRLEWVEQLRIIEKRWPGVTIKYDISPQKLIPKEGSNGAVPPIPAGAKLPNGDPVKQFGVFGTDMKLTLMAMHEGDALAILDELKTAKLGLFTVKKCTMKRPNNTIVKDTSTDVGAPLSIDCTLNWVSMNTY